MRKPIAISDLLAERKVTLDRLRTGAEAATRVLVAVQQALPAESAEHVWSASEKAGVLTVVVDSAGWATRVRYSVPELQAGAGATLGVTVTKVLVRVRPRPVPRPGA